MNFIFNLKKIDSNLMKIFVEKNSFSLYFFFNTAFFSR